MIFLINSSQSTKELFQILSSLSPQIREEIQSINCILHPHEQEHSKRIIFQKPLFYTHKLKSKSKNTRSIQLLVNIKSLTKPILQILNNHPNFKIYTSVNVKGEIQYLENPKLYIYLLFALDRISNEKKKIKSKDPLTYYKPKLFRKELFSDHQMIVFQFDNYFKDADEGSKIYNKIISDIFKDRPGRLKSKRIHRKNNVYEIITGVEELSKPELRRLRSRIEQETLALKRIRIILLGEIPGILRIPNSRVVMYSPNIHQLRQEEITGNISELFLGIVSDTLKTIKPTLKFEIQDQLITRNVFGELIRKFPNQDAIKYSVSMKYSNLNFSKRINLLDAIFWYDLLNVKWPKDILESKLTLPKDIDNKLQKVNKPVADAKTNPKAEVVHKRVSENLRKLYFERDGLIWNIKLGTRELKSVDYDLLGVHIIKELYQNHRRSSKSIDPLELNKNLLDRFKVKKETSEKRQQTLESKKTTGKISKINKLPNELALDSFRGRLKTLYNKCPQIDFLKEHIKLSKYGCYFDTKNELVIEFISD